METIRINNTVLEFNKIIYVDAINGSDEVGDGSKNNPYRTLQIAINNSNKGNAIKLAEGVYPIYSILNMISVDSLNFIGENINTTIEVQNSSYIAMPGHSSNFYNLVIKPSDAFSGDQRSIFYSNGSSGRYILRFYNIVFAKSSNNLYPTTWWFIWHQNTKTNRDVVFNNCSFEKVSTEVALYGGTQQRYINCAFENSNWNTGTKEYCLYNINLDSDYSILDEGWQNTGTGLNPDGTQAHIGVYGGEFGWGVWLPPQPIDSISYSTNQKSVGDTILISWGESANATRYELQYFNGVEWITINNNITDTEYVYTFTEPNPAAKFRVRGVNSEGVSDWVVGEEFEVTCKSEIESSLIVNPQNKMRGFISIIGAGDSDLDSNLTVRQSYSKYLDTSLTITKKHVNKDIESIIVVAQRDYNELDSSIALNPSGRMRGYVDIVQPPKKVLKIYPIKDSVVRQSAPTINYGNSQQMLAGEVGEGKFISYLGFNLELPEDIELISVKLILNKQYETSKTFFMGLYETSDDWEEYDITWGFRPLDEDYITQFLIPMEAGEVEADITEWEGNKSFIVRPRNYSLADLTTFGTRESLYPPYIEVVYYDIIGNPGSHSLDSSITVARRVQRDLSASIDVESDYTYSELEGSIELKRKDIDSDLNSSITVSNLRHIEVGGELEIEEKPQEIEIDATVIVPYGENLDSSIELKRKEREDALDSSIEVRAYSEEDLNSNLEIENKYVNEDLESSIIVKQDTEENLDSSLEIENKYIDSDLNSSISVGVGNRLDLNSSLNIIKKEIYVDLNSFIIVRKFEKNNLDSQLVIESKYDYSNIDGSLNIRSYGEYGLDSSLEVPKIDDKDDLDSGIYIKFRSDLESSLEIVDIESKEEVGGELELEAKRRTSSIDSSMIVRVFWVSELESSLTITRNFEIDGSLTIKEKETFSDLDCSLTIESGGDYAFIM